MARGLYEKKNLSRLPKSAISKFFDRGIYLSQRLQGMYRGEGMKPSVDRYFQGHRSIDRRFRLGTLLQALGFHNPPKQRLLNSLGFFLRCSLPYLIDISIITYRRSIACNGRCRPNNAKHCCVQIFCTQVQVTVYRTKEKHESIDRVSFLYRFRDL